MSVYVYPAIVHKEGETYGVTFPDLPGCVSVGDSQTEIALNASEALSGHLEVMMAADESIPDASAIETVQIDTGSGDIGAILVTAYAARSLSVA